MDIDDNIQRQLSEVESLRVGGPTTHSEVTLCIYFDDLDPGFVTKTVKCDPTSFQRKGERDAKHPKRPLARFGKWFLETPADLSFEDKIEFLLDSTTADESAWEMLAKSHKLVLSVGIFLKSWNEGFDLTAELISRIAGRKWMLRQDMYSAEGGEILAAFLNRSKSSS